MTVIFDVQWHIGRFWFVTARLDTCFRSELFVWWDLFITKVLEEMKGPHGKHVRGFAEEQQEGVTRFHWQKGAAEIPNMAKAPLEVCMDTSRVCNDRVEKCQLHFSKRLSTEKADDASFLDIN